METLYARCAGLDVHKETVVACARAVAGGRVQHDVATFGTTTAGLRRLREWLAAHRCTHVAMEATGVYWRPVWHVLDGQFSLVLANATQVRNVPGRKTDVNDVFRRGDVERFLAERAERLDAHEAAGRRLPAGVGKPKPES